MFILALRDAFFKKKKILSPPKRTQDRKVGCDWKFKSSGMLYRVD